jgi:tetratricopeptide (TPR) repeat protein
MTLFEKAFNLQPSDKIVVEHMGDAYFKTGNKDKALEFWMKAKELGSTNKNLDKKIEKKEYYDPNY